MLPLNGTHIMDVSVYQLITLCVRNTAASKSLLFCSSIHQEAPFRGQKCEMEAPVHKNGCFCGQDWPWIILYEPRTSRIRILGHLCPSITSSPMECVRLLFCPVFENPAVDGCCLQLVAEEYSDESPFLCFDRFSSFYGRVSVKSFDFK